MCHACGEINKVKMNLLFVNQNFGFFHVLMQTSGSILSNLNVLNKQGTKTNKK
jgi:hypothetical protein